jgi:hypothetical protein
MVAVDTVYSVTTLVASFPSVLQGVITARRCCFFFRFPQISALSSLHSKIWCNSP